MELTVTDRIRELRKIEGVSVNNFIGRKYASEFEDALRRYREWGDVSSFIGDGYVAYSQQPLTGIVLATHQDEYQNIKGNVNCLIEYAFLANNGQVLPDLECCGRIGIKKLEKLYECYRILRQGFKTYKI